MLEFKTKTDRNGNSLKLRVYLASKKYEWGHFVVTYTPITVSKKDIYEIKATFEIEGFKEV